MAERTSGGYNMGVVWRGSKQKDKRGQHNFEGGLNTGLSSFDVKDDQYISGFGWETDKHPALITRKGRQPYGIAGTGITRLLTSFGNAHLVRAIGTALSYNSSGTTWTAITGTFTDADWDACSFDLGGAVLILTNSVDPVKYWNGTTLTNLSANAPLGKYITSDISRVWIAKDDVIYFCKFQDPTDWVAAEDSGAVQYYTPRGGNITALTVFQSLKCVWKKDSFAVIYGTSFFDYRLVDISNDIGCISFKTVQEVGSTLYWLGQNDVYTFSGGYPVAIGEPIREYLDDINTTHLDKCFAGTDGLRYELGLVTGANTEPNILLTFDPRRKGNPWNVKSEINGLRYSATFDNVLYCGDYLGQTYKLNSGTDDNGTAIPWEVVTKDFDEGMPEAEKEYYELHLQIDAPTGTTLTVQASVDQGETYTTVGDPITTDTVAQNVNMIIPLDTVSISNWIRFRISGSGQFTLYQVQRYFRVQPVMH